MRFLFHKLFSILDNLRAHIIVIITCDFVKNNHRQNPITKNVEKRFFRRRIFYTCVVITNHDNSIIPIGYIRLFMSTGFTINAVISVIHRKSHASG